MVFAHQAAIGLFQFVLARDIGHAQDHIRVGQFRREMSGADAAEFIGRETENFRHPFQERRFARMQHPVGLGDLEQPVENVFQHRRIADEQPRDLAGIDLEAGDILARHVEHAAHIGFLLRRHAEGALERFQFRLAHHAVGLGHLAGQRDHRDGEGDAGIGILIDQEMTGHRPDQRPDGTADQKAGTRAADLSPNRHRKSWAPHPSAGSGWGHVRRRPPRGDYS